MLRLVIDTDPGVDDAQAIMMAAAHPGAKIEAITTVAGNVPLARTTANACTILDILEADAPVYAGCDRGIVALMDNASYVHGEDGLGNTNYPPSSREVAAEHAVNALNRLGDEEPGELTLVALGPLTNVALATRLDPTLPDKYKRLVVMGGAIRSMGNTPGLSSEFNFYADPEAAAIVMDAWSGVTLVSWETTMAHPIPPELVEKMGAFQTPRAEFFGRITQETIKYIREVLEWDRLVAADPLAMAVALEPDIVQAAESHHVRVELSGGGTGGQSTVDWYDRSGLDHKAEIVLELDREWLWELMEAAVK